MNEQIFKQILVLCVVLFLTSADETDWDYFTFSQEWPQTTCLMAKEATPSKTCSIPKYITCFGIHGLWPTTVFKPGPERCKNNTWDKNSIMNLTNELGRDWPNIFKSTDPDEFWKDEWNKHGTCALTLTATDSQYKYFKKALDLMSKYNISRSLQNARIFPDDKKLYNASKVARLLKDDLVFEPELKCFRRYKENTVQLLAEIRICMDKKFKLISCRKNSDTRLLFKHSNKWNDCTGYFKFPKIRRNHF